MKTDAQFQIIRRVCLKTLLIFQVKVFGRLSGYLVAFINLINIFVDLPAINIRFLKEKHGHVLL